MLLKMKSISKDFPGAHALSNVDFSCCRGEVHALVGENGAGKSTLTKILGGVYRQDKGKIILNGEEVIISDPSKANGLGISIVYQDAALIPYLTIVQNVFLGREQVSKFNFIHSKNMKNQVKKEMSEVIGIDINPDSLVGDLPFGQKQMVAIYKALYMRHIQIVIMDEPTAPLSIKEVQLLFNIIRSLRKQNKTIIYISHRLEEIFQIADRVTVLKDGKLVNCKEVKETNKNELVKMMTGREIGDWFPPKSHTRNHIHIKKERLLDVRELSAVGLEDINLTLHKGEILGIAGLQGQGQEKLVRVIFGDEPKRKGRIYLSEKELEINNPSDALRAGIVFMSDDKKQEGLVLSLSVLKNVTLPPSNKRQKFGFIKGREEKRVVMKVSSDTNIKFSSINQEVQYLSGGNQQKVIIAKWMLSGFKVALFVAPTQGIDVGAKKEIYYLMRKLTEKGRGILMVSYELPEILGISDRIIVMYKGKIVQEFYIEEATEEKIMLAAVSG